MAQSASEKFVIGWFLKGIRRARCRDQPATGRWSGAGKASPRCEQFHRDFALINGTAQVKVEPLYSA
jgi:hypothetical protein